MSQSETCLECGQENCNDYAKGGPKVFPCNRCGFVMTLVIEEEPKDIFAQKSTVNWYTVIATLLCMAGTVIIIEDFLYGVLKKVAIVCYLSLAIAYALLASRRDNLESKGQVVLFGTFSLIFFVAALFRWAGFEFGPFILELLIRITG